MNDLDFVRELKSRDIFLLLSFQLPVEKYNIILRARWGKVQKACLD